jgi:2-succinyl-6-hydroxy-2,4-cyclohexadiene-1-carboxylate synthase
MPKHPRCEAITVFKNSICDNESLFEFETWEEWIQDYISVARDYEDREANTLRVGVGYSMGGRLLLSLLAHEPTIWDYSVMISTHPGLCSEVEREERHKQDTLWQDRLAELFEEGEPSPRMIKEFLDLWQKQPVFAHDPPEDRFVDLAEFAEVCLHALGMFSLAVQPSFWEFLVQYQPRGLWVTGQKDEKFCKIAKTLQEQIQKSSVKLESEANSSYAKLQFLEIPSVGHRIKGGEKILARQCARGIAQTCFERFER